MKRKLDVYLEGNDTVDVEVVQVGLPDIKKRKLVKVISGRNVIFSEKKLRVYINKARNDLKYIQSRLFGNMDFVIGGVHMNPPFILTLKCLAEHEIDYVCQISKNIDDIHLENVYIRETGKLLVLIPRKPNIPIRRVNHANILMLPPPMNASPHNQIIQPPPPRDNYRPFGTGHMPTQNNIHPPPNMYQNFWRGQNSIQRRGNFGQRKKKKKKKKRSSSNFTSVDDLEDDFDM